jgi:hypothetical protein
MFLFGGGLQASVMHCYNAKRIGHTESRCRDEVNKGKEIQVFNYSPKQFLFVHIRHTQDANASWHIFKQD